MFGKRLNANVELLDEIVQRMESTKSNENSLANQVKNERLDNRKYAMELQIIL